MKKAKLQFSEQNIIDEFYEITSNIDRKNYEKEIKKVLSWWVIIETPSLFLAYRKLFQKAKLPETVKWLYENIIIALPERYKNSSIIKYAEQWVPDILLRKEFFETHTWNWIIVDIGSSDWYFAVELGKSSHREVIGIDMLPDRVERANQFARDNNTNTKFICGFAENIPLEDDVSDTSILSHMLEHVQSPLKVLDETYRITKSWGKIIAIVPDNIWRDPTHIRFIKSEQLLNWLEKYGKVSEKYLVWTKWIGYICQISKI